MENRRDLADLRQEYSLRGLSRKDVRDNPFDQFGIWFEDAVAAEIVEPNAMTVGTSAADGQPSGRTVLLKSFDSEGFVFFTNYQSAKARELAANPKCFLHFFWRELERQIFISGVAHKIPEKESDVYFASRPRESRIGAWASQQSEVVESREFLEDKFREFETKFADNEIPRPPHWGGFQVKPTRVEFWQGRPSRLHDRLLYVAVGDSWTINRLSP